MKIEELRLLIKEVVQETMREELSSILTEAVKIASTPSQQSIVSSTGPRQPLNLPTPDWVKELAVPGTVAETYQPRSTKENVGMKKDPMSLLAETARGMSREDFNNFSSGI